MIARHLKGLSGVYAIVHRESGKVYVGSAVNLFKRLREHRRKLRKGEHDSPRLLAAWNKYGEAAFAFAVIQFRPIAEIIPTEQRWIDEFDATGPRGYNSNPTAGSCLGQKRSAASIEKVAASKRGVSQTAEHRAAISAANKGRPKPEGFGARISSAKKGIRTTVLGPDSLAKVSAALKGRKQDPEFVKRRVAAGVAARKARRLARMSTVQGELFD